MWTMTLLSFISAAALSMLGVRGVLALAHRFRIYDDPQARSESATRKVHSGSIPRLGGIAIFLSFLAVSAVFSETLDIYKVIGFSLPLFVLGLWDDLNALGSSIRLAVQSACAMLMTWSLDLPVQLVSLPPFEPFELPYLAGFFLSVFVLVGAVNAVNMIDGLDGLASGVISISIILLSYILFVTKGPSFALASICLPILGIMLGFLRYNANPARIFLGDSGTYWLGCIVGVIMLYAFKPATGLSQGLVPGLRLVPLPTVLLTMAVPIIDTAAVIVARLFRGESPLKADSSHLHHSLLRIGLSQKQSVATIYFLSFAFGILGLLPPLYPRYELWWIYYLSFAALLMFIFLCHKVNGEFIKRLISYKRLTYDRYGLAVRAVIRLLDGSLRGCIYGILLLAPLLSGRITQELSVMAGIVAASIIAAKTFSKTHFDQFNVSLVSIGIGIVLIGINQTPLTITAMGERHVVQHIYNYLFYFLFFAALIYFLLTFKRRYLRVTLVDFLAICVPILLLLLPEGIIQQYRLNVVSLRAMIILPIISLFAKKSRYSFEKIELVTLLSLITVALIGLFRIRIFVG